MSFTDVEAIKIFKDNYFWTILIIDLTAFIYLFLSGNSLSQTEL